MLLNRGAGLNSGGLRLVGPVVRRQVEARHVADLAERQDPTRRVPLRGDRARRVPHRRDGPRVQGRGRPPRHRPPRDRPPGPPEDRPHHDLRQRRPHRRLPADERVGLSAECWGWVRSTDRVCTVLDVAEIEGMSGLVRWLDEHGQTYVRGAGLGWAETPETMPGYPVPRDEGVGYGWVEGTPAVLRGRDQSGRRCRRPSDRPSRWSDDARRVLTGPDRWRIAGSPL